MAFPPMLNAFLARALTLACAGQRAPLEPPNGANAPLPSPGQPLVTPVGAPAPTLEGAGVPSRETVATPRSNGAPSPIASPVAFSGFEAPDGGSPLYVPFDPSKPPTQVRLGEPSPRRLADFREQLARAAAKQAARDERRAAKAASALPPVPESPPPQASLAPSEEGLAADLQAALAMDGYVAASVARYAGGVSKLGTSKHGHGQSHTRLSDWFEVPAFLGKYVTGGQTSDCCVEVNVAHTAYLAAQLAQSPARDFGARKLLQALLSAEEAMTPRNHKEAMAMDAKNWRPAEQKGLGSHSKNGSWVRIKLSGVPKGRRLHKLV